MSQGYSRVLSILERARSELREVPLPAPESPVSDWLRRLQEAEVRAADVACEAFARDRSWPVIRVDSIVAQLHLRLLSAMGVCRGLQHRTLHPGIAERELLRRLLIDYWHGRVARWLPPAPSKPVVSPVNWTVVPPGTG